MFSFGGSFIKGKGIPAEYHPTKKVKFTSELFQPGSTKYDIATDKQMMICMACLDMTVIPAELSAIYRSAIVNR